MPGNVQKKMILGLLPVVLALAGNSFIAVIKFIGFFISGSSVLFSEAVHSLADTSNQALLLIGVKRSVKKADAEFPYGYGQERFFWALVSACGIFFVGAGVTIYRGIWMMTHHKEVLIGPVIFAILAISFIIETITFLVAVKELRATNKDLSWIEILKDGDPAALAVFYEDGVALLGIFIASVSILLTRLTGQIFYDAAGSILIGILLGAIAAVLINKNRRFLTKKSIPEELKEKIIEIMIADPAIEKVLDFKSSVIDVGIYRIKCEVEFNGPGLLKEIFGKGEIREEYDEVKNDYNKFVKFCVDYADRIPRLIGKKMDEIEKKIQAEAPQIKHIDIEIN